MSLRRRRPFAELIGRQLDLFEQAHAGLLRDCTAAIRAYDAAPRDEATERYGHYRDLVETAAELLADVRDGYARTLEEDPAEEYEAAFNRAVARRLPMLGADIESI